MRHKYAANQIAELTLKIVAAIKEPSNKIFYRGYVEFCKQHSKLTPLKIMQFKYMSTTFYIEGDVPNPRAQHLHPSLVDEFAQLHQFYVVDLQKLISKVKYMVSDVTRLAVTHEDLYALLPESLHPVLDKITYTATSATNSMDLSEVGPFKDKYQSLFADIDMRIFLGAAN